MNLRTGTILCGLFVSTALVAGAAAPLAVVAQPAPQTSANPAKEALLAIKTWGVRGEPGQVVYTSPAKAGQPSMKIILPLVQNIGGETLETWFKSATKVYITRLSAGKGIHKRSGVSPVLVPAGKTLTESIAFKSASGKGGDIVLVTGWQAAGGAQIVIELIPEQMPEGDISAKQSGDYVGVLSGLRFALTAEKLELQTKNNR